MIISYYDMITYHVLIIIIYIIIISFLFLSLLCVGGEIRDIKYLSTIVYLVHMFIVHLSIQNAICTTIQESISRGHPPQLQLQAHYQNSLVTK